MTLSVVRTKLGCVVDTVIEEVPVTVMYPLTAVAVIVAVALALDISGS